MSRDEQAFSAEETRALACALDEIIPPGEGGLPGAGELGLAAAIEEAARGSDEVRAAVREGIATLEELARGRGKPGYAELPRNERLEVLNEAGAKAPLFLPNLIGPAFVGYYQDLRVREALGLETRPPHPQGYEVEPTDFSILDPVRERGPFYRTG